VQHDLVEQPGSQAVTGLANQDTCTGAQHRRYQG
jgi:hypothetical protein